MNNNNIHPILLNTHIAGTHKGHVPGNQQGVLSNRGIQEGFVGLKIYFETHYKLFKIYDT